MSKKKEQVFIPKDQWPKSLIDSGFTGQLESTPFSEHGVEIPYQYQSKVHGELPSPLNYIPIEQAVQIQKLDHIRLSSYGQLRGISATGKGTRMYQLISYLRSKFKWTFYSTYLPAYRKKDSNGYVPTLPINNLGIFFPELNLLIPGRIVKSNKSRLLSFTGADMITAGWSHDTLFDINIEFAINYNWLYEGYTGLDNAKLNPKWLMEESNEKKLKSIDSFFYRFYHHPNKEEMLERFKSRSFHVAKGDAAYGQNENHSTISYRVVQKELNELLDNGKSIESDISLDESDIDINEFVKSYLMFIGLHELVPDYLNWQESFGDCKRDYRDAQKNYDDFWYQWQFQMQYEKN